MMRLRRSALVLLLFTLSACAQANVAPQGDVNSDVVQTAAVSAAQTAVSAASPTLTPLPTISFSTTPLPSGELPTSVPDSNPAATSSSLTLTSTATPTAAVFPSNFSPVLLGKKYDSNMFFTLLGGVQGGSWISPDQAAANMPGASAYDVYPSASGPHLVYGYAPEKSMIHPDYFLHTDAVLNETGMIGVLQGWQVRHGTAQELPSNHDLYRQVMLDFLAQSGVTNPQTGTMHIYRIDLEGDGSDEIFISDTLVESSHGVVAGDHSVVVMRKVSGTSAVTVPILVDLYTAIGYGNPFPCTYSVANFIDLNQDGVLEVIIEFDRWEDFGGSVYQVNGENVEQILGRTCINP